MARRPSTSAFADTFVLKDGTTIEGTVIRQDDDANYVIEVQVTSTIKDERVIPKADVVRNQARRNRRSPRSRPSPA